MSADSTRTARIIADMAMQIADQNKEDTRSMLEGALDGFLEDPSSPEGSPRKYDTSLEAAALEILDTTTRNNIARNTSIDLAPLGSPESKRERTNEGQRCAAAAYIVQKSFARTRSNNIL